MPKSRLDTNFSFIDSTGPTKKRLLELEHRFRQFTRSLNDLRDPIKILSLQKLLRDTANEGREIADKLGIAIPDWCHFKF